MPFAYMINEKIRVIVMKESQFLTISISVTVTVPLALACIFISTLSQ